MSVKRNSKVRLSLTKIQAHNLALILRHNLSLPEQLGHGKPEREQAIKRTMDEVRELLEPSVAPTKRWEIIL